VGENRRRRESGARMKKPVWIGLLDLRPRRGNDLLGEVGGAYVQALAPAESREEFVAVWTPLMEDADYDVLSIENAEPFDDRRRRESPDPRLVEIAQHVWETQQPAHDDEWFTYPREDEDADD
jgi:hypothetical protein